MSKDKYVLKLTTLSNVSYDLIIQLTRITIFSSKDLYDFYCMTARFPTIEEINIASKMGFRALYDMIKLTSSEKVKPNIFLIYHDNEAFLTTWFEFQSMYTDGMIVFDFLNETFYNGKECKEIEHDVL